MTRTGIDISTYQDPTQIDYDKLAKNVDFVILRAGFSGWGDQAPHKDETFETHYRELHKRNIPLGAYYYSTADTKDLAEKEANAFLSYVKDKEFSYPLTMDVEDEHNQAKLSKADLTNVVIHFLDKVEKAGYFVNLYCSEYWINSKLEAQRLTRFDKWIAKWSSNNPTNIEYGMWQFTSDFRVDGYNNRLDGNRAYKDYPTIIKNAGLNKLGKEKKPAKKSITTIVNEVLAGKWGNGQERKDRLSKAGYDYNKVQTEVNKKLYQDKEKTYKVKAGDSWWSIAEKVYGNGQKMHDLAKKNGKTINHTIHPNNVIKY